MDIEIFKEVKQLHKITQEIYIYGCKTIAGRLFYTLVKQGIAIKGFIVSKKYDNPNTFFGKPVYRIEDCTNQEFGYVILAVSQEFIEDCVNELMQYRIKQLGIISYILDRELIGAYELNSCIHISKLASICPLTRIYADETSEIIIDPYVCIVSGDIIALNHSKIILSSSCLLQKVKILAENESKVTVERKTAIGNGQKNVAIDAFDRTHICVGEKVRIGGGTTVFAHDSNIEIGANCNISYNVEIGPVNRGKVHIGTNVSILWGSTLNAGQGGKLFIGDNSNFGQYSNIRGNICIKETCLFSSFVKFVGNHKIFNSNNQEIVDNQETYIGDHVWAGMGATFMSGCNVGQGAIVGAQTLVRGMIPERCMCVGIPARIIKSNVSWEF